MLEGRFFFACTASAYVDDRYGTSVGEHVRKQPGQVLE